MKNKKKGFTLIELLAVIIILGVLMLIAVPSVTEYIGNSRKKAFLSSAYNILDNAKRYVVANAIIEGKEFTISNGSFSGDGFDVRGKLPNSGTISVNGQMQTSISVTDGTWCAKKTYSDNEIIVIRDDGNCSIDSVELTEESCFSFNSGTGMITGYYDNEENNSSNPACPNDIAIPSSIGGVEVTSIGPGALITVEKYGQYCYTYDEETDEWGPDIDVGLDYIHTDSDGYYDCYFDIDWDNLGRLTSVVIPSSVISIGDYAFYYNQLTSITIGNSVTTIGEYAFRDNQLTTVIIPDSVTTIGNYAFNNNQLTSATIGNSVTTIGEGAFEDNQLMTVIIPDSVTTIGNYAFVNNQLTSATIGNSVTTIGDYAFEYNQLTSATIGNSVKIIGEGAFRDNQLNSVTIPNSVTTIGYYAFEYNQLTSATIGNGVTIIYDYAFENNQLTSITIGNSVTTIGDYVFKGNQLTSIAIPDSVTTIGDYAFEYNQLANITIGNSVTTIGDYAFGDNQLTSITIPNSVTTIGDYAFEHNQLTRVTIPANVSIETNSISLRFYTSYITDNSKAAGTYIALSQYTDAWIKPAIPTIANAPQLATGMVPIKWNGTTWVDTTTDDSDWYSYDYTNKKWANARTQDGSMWVWIPRYAYQIATCYHMSSGECSGATMSFAGTIDIKFLIGTTNTTSDSTQIYEDNATNTHYVKHPAFRFGTTELTGVWVAKFEMSGTTASLDSKPNVVSLGNITLGNMFTASRNMETNNKYGWGLASGLNTTTGVFATDTNNVDTHAMKNSEWAAVAYLSKSSYGKFSEIYINPSSSYITGRGGNTASQGITTDTSDTASTDLYSYDGKSCSTKIGYECTGAAQSTYGMTSSTTGNIYGIYDISGGAYEYTMGNYNNTAGSSGLAPSSINSKYINIYSTTGSGYDASNYGDAVWETSSSSSSNKSWFGDATVIPYTSNPWFMRGGGPSDYGTAGAFFFYRGTGEGYSNVSWRSVVLVGSGL